MRFTELFEGVEPKLPGAPKGIKIMTPQQFVAKADDEKLDEFILSEGERLEKAIQILKGLGFALSKTGKGASSALNTVKKIGDTVKTGWSYLTSLALGAGIVTHPKEMWNAANFTWNLVSNPGETAKILWRYAKEGIQFWSNENAAAQDLRRIMGNSVTSDTIFAIAKFATDNALPIAGVIALLYGGQQFVNYMKDNNQTDIAGKQSFDRIGKELGQGASDNKSQVKEATTLAAPSRPISDPELTDYLDRIRTQQKKKTDKYKLPYIHRSSVISYYNEQGKKYDIDAIKQALAERPKALLKKNEKMKHSDGEQEQFFNVGFAALVGIALDENTNELIVVNTCPGAGSCKIECFAMKGGKVQFQGPWLSDGRILTYLLNDPDGFFERLKAEITKEVAKGKKSEYKVSIRWHDAGDFFSPEYAAMAFKLASELPDVDFYAYTKVADVALGQKPDNFIINWSEGASASQEKKVKGQDAGLEQTKNSRIVPSNLFYDLLVKDEKKNLVKGPEGQWQVIPDKLPELKQRLAKQYGISANSILSYDEYDSRRLKAIQDWYAKNNDRIQDLLQKGTKQTDINNMRNKEMSQGIQMKYNVIITPGEPDLTAKDPGVLSTLLLKH